MKVKNTQVEAGKQILDIDNRTRQTLKNKAEDWGLNTRQGGDNETQVQTLRGVATNHKGGNPEQEVTDKTKENRTESAQTRKTIIHME